MIPNTPVPVAAEAGRRHLPSASADDALVAWLATELAGSEPLPAEADAAAEEALRQAFTTLPWRDPSPGFAARVMLAAELRPAGLRRGWWQWAAVAAGLVGFGLALAFVMPVLGPLLTTLDIGDLLGAGTTLTVALGTWLADGLRMWEGLSALSRGLSVVLSTPLGVRAVVLSLLVCLTALRLLTQLAGSERSASHAPARIA